MHIVAVSAPRAIVVFSSAVTSNLGGHREQDMITGTVKWFDSKKGFGFILNSEGRDVFVHFSCIEGDGFRALKDGEKVEYEEFNSDKGLSARAVRRIPSESRVAAVAR
jgi:CspA family cold shock protein